MTAASDSTLTPRWVATPAADLLDLLADADRVVGRDANDLFLIACEEDANLNGGRVSVNRVRARLAAVGAQIPPRRFSAMWSAYVGPGKPMIKTVEWEVCSGSSSRNDGRPYAVRRVRGHEKVPTGGQVAVPTGGHLGSPLVVK